MNIVLLRIKELLNCAIARKKGNVLKSNGALCRFRNGAASNTVSISPEISAKVQKKIKISVSGRNNTLIIDAGVRIRKSLKIAITGSGNKVHIQKNVRIEDSLSITLGCNMRNGVCSIGEGTSFWKTSIGLADHASEVFIGRDCMFSWDTEIAHSDTHTILINGTVANHAKTLRIGDHVWAGWGSTFLKNCHVASGSIVGRASIVAGKFSEENVVLAGVPAKVVRSGVEWSRKSVNEIEDSQRPLV